MGKTLLGRRHVLPPVLSSLHEMQVEGTFPTGTYLVTVHDPISTEDGDLKLALYGSFLPVPDQSCFRKLDPSVYHDDNVPGAVQVKRGTRSKSQIVLNQNRKRIKIRVTNKGDRPVQVCLILPIFPLITPYSGPLVF